MTDCDHHDQIIAKIQAFADWMKQSKQEKESYALLLAESEEKNQVRKEILIYNEILVEYFEIFGEILQK